VIFGKPGGELEKQSIARTIGMGSWFSIICCLGGSAESSLKNGEEAYYFW